MNTRRLGTICLITGSVAVLDALRWAVLRLTDFDALGTAVLLVWCLGSIAGLLGLVALNAVGASLASRALAFVPVLGFGLLASASVLQLAGLASGETALISLGWLIQLAGMVLVAILTIGAKVWGNWRRFVPLLCILALPAGVGLGALFNLAGLNALPVYLAWALLGYAVRTALPNPVRPELI